jgi:hypothetical protein
MSKVVGDEPLHSRKSLSLKARLARLASLFPVSLTRHSHRNARLHSIAVQLGKSLRLAAPIAALTVFETDGNIITVRIVRRAQLRRGNEREWRWAEV